MCNTDPVSKLIDSPMFNLSLSSKELFHSNFLAWLGNNPDTNGFFTEVINELVFGLDLQPGGDWTVKREDKHFDLCIKDGKGEAKDNYLLIIENKVKSIPLKRQLDQYVKKDVRWKDGHKKYLLLTLTEKFAHRTKIDKAITTNGSPNNWIVKTYKDLASVMRNKQKLVTKTNLRFFLEDYICFIENLDALVRQWQDEEKFAQKWDKIPKLHDLHAKIQFSRYCEKLKKEYFEERKKDKCSIFNDIIVYDDDDIPEDVKNDKIYIKVDWDYSSQGQTGHLDVEIPVSCLDDPKIVKGLAITDGKPITPYNIQIQVQGDKYCHVIETNTNVAKNGPIGDRLIEIGRSKLYTDSSSSGLYFFSIDPIDPPLPIPKYGTGVSGTDSIFKDAPCLYPVNRGNEKNQIPPERWPFASYKDKKKHIHFIYQSRKIKPDALIKDVLKNIAAEVERIVSFLLKRTSP